MIEADRVTSLVEDLTAIEAADISILEAVVRAPGRRIAAPVTTAKCRLWLEMESLGWLREIPTEGSRHLTLTFPTATFVVTDAGRTEIPGVLRLLRQRRTREIGARAEAPRPLGWE
jgi:hypothetical protein